MLFLTGNSSLTVSRTTRNSVVLRMRIYWAFRRRGWVHATRVCLTASMQLRRFTGKCGYGIIGFVITRSEATK